MHTRVVVSKQSTALYNKKTKTCPQSNSNNSNNHGAHNHSNKHSPTTCVNVNAMFNNKNFADTQHKPKPKKKKKSTSLQDFCKTTTTTPMPIVALPKQKEEEECTSPIQDSSQCSICHDALSDVTASTNCNHVFCYHCISEWTTNYLSTCPLCKTKVTSLTKHDAKNGTKDEQQIPYVSNLLSFDPNELSQREIFACLDHNYFLQEIMSLQTMADRILDQLRPTVNTYRSCYKLSTPQKNMNERRWKSVHEVKNTLQSMATEFRYLKEFDPSSCLEQLYAIHEELKQLQECLLPQSHASSNNSTNAKTTTIRFDPHSNSIEMFVQEEEMYADEMAAFYEDEEYYYDEAYDEEQAASVMYKCK